MAQKVATYIGPIEDGMGAEIRQLIEDAGIHLIVRDTVKDPMTARELDQLLGHNPLTHFINPAASEYEKLGLDKRKPERPELLELIAENPGLLKRPIIKSARLVTVGSNKDKILEMLQISRNGKQIDDINGNRGGRITRRSLPSKK